MKSKGEREKYTHLNTEFQGITERDKKAFLSNKYKEKEIKKGKMSEEALQIAEKRREAKGNGEKERYIHLNAESKE